ncbi:hypothetical protein Q3G72_002820 [Acer saccharum]|nr:hypothetical protein Q3G72_002820 [Acer saccharum]
MVDVEPATLVTCSLCDSSSSSPLHGAVISKSLFAFPILATRCSSTESKPKTKNPNPEISIPSLLEQIVGFKGGPPSVPFSDAEEQIVGFKDGLG